MATTNDVTGDELKSRGNTDAYKDGYDRIWGNRNKRKDDCAGSQHSTEQGDTNESQNQKTSS